MDRIPVSGPWITEKEISYVTDAVTNAWYGNANMYHERFEPAFAAYVERKYAMALPSCTSALHLSMLALGIGQGDEVIVPDITWIASAAPISYVGATPIFADIDRATWCLDAGSFERTVTPRTKAVIVVDLYGSMPDMDAILDVAARHNIAVIEDAAEAIGSLYRGRKAGSFGLASTFSFHGSKTLTTGEGGMLVTDDPDIHARCLFLRDHGRQPGEKAFFNTEIGYKYRMSSMQAALGLAQLERVDELVERKRQIFSWYAERLSGIEGMTLNAEPPGTLNSYWMVSIILDKRFGIDKDELMRYMSDHNIDCRPFFRPLSSLPAYAYLPQAARAEEENAVSYALSPYGLNLPCGMNMTEEKVSYVCSIIESVIKEARVVV